MKEIKEPSVSTWKGCMQQCWLEKDCQVWTFKIRAVECKLFNDLITVKGNGGISGERFCGISKYFLLVTVY